MNVAQVVSTVQSGWTSASLIFALSSTALLALVLIVGVVIIARLAATQRQAPGHSHDASCDNDASQDQAGGSEATGQGSPPRTPL